MKKILAELKEEEGVTGDKIIKIHIKSPNVPCLDLIDMPGLVASGNSVRMCLHNSCFHASDSFSWYVHSDFQPYDHIHKLQFLIYYTTLTSDCGRCDMKCNVSQEALRAKLPEKTKKLVTDHIQVCATMLFLGPRRTYFS